MKRFSVKKAVSVLMTGAVLLGFTGCLDLGGGKKAVLEAADTLASDMISASASKLIKSSNLDKKSKEAESLTEILDDSSASDDQKAFYKAFEGAVEYEIDEESCTVKKGEGSVDIVFTMPDYESVLKEDFTDIDEVTSAVKKAKTKEFTFTAEFVQEDKEWVASNVGSKKFLKFYDYRSAEIDLALTAEMIADLVDYSLTSFWLTDSDGTYTDTTFIELDVYFDSKVYDYAKRGVYFYYELFNGRDSLYKSENILLGESTTVACRIDSDQLDLGMFAVIPAGNYTISVNLADGDEQILLYTVDVKETPKPTPGAGGSGNSDKTFDGEGTSYDFYDKSFKDYVLDAGWFNYDGSYLGNAMYTSQVKTIGFSMQVTAECDKRIDYFYAYSATQSSEDVKAALNNPIYKNSALPAQYDNGYFYDLDYEFDGDATPGIYIIVAMESGTNNYILYGYCLVA